MEAQEHEITQILLDAYDGDEDAANKLWEMVYRELQQIAHRELRRERPDHTLSTTALVHEAYLKLVDHTRITWRNRAHFFALACRAMRRILVNYARDRNVQKRQTQKHKVPLDEAMLMAEERSEELVALDEALTRLAARDERLGQVVECRYFGGFTTKETAEVMGISTRTVERDWERARAYLYKTLRLEE